MLTVRDSVLVVSLGVIGLCLTGILGAAPAPDPRNFGNGWLLPDENYCDQPRIVVARDGTWVCVLTTGKGEEGAPGQHVVSASSADQGRTWSGLVDVEPADPDRTSAYALALITPGDRVYAFYCYNGDGIRSLPDGTRIRDDMQGWLCFRYSDDRGRSWSERHRIPLRVTAADRRNQWGGRLQLWWAIGTPASRRSPCSQTVVATRHEGGAGFMAAAVGALTGRPAAVLVTRAVGATNLAIGLHAAHADSAPLIALVGQVDRGVRGREAFQEIDLAGTVGRLCRWAAEVRDAASLPAMLDEGLRKAMNGRPGPVLLALPADLLEEDVPVDQARTASGPVLGPPRAPAPDPAAVKRVLHLLLDAERPVILAGAGVLRSRSTADLVKLAETIEVPVIAGWRRPDVFPNDHHLYLGMSGYFAAPTVRERLLAADAILVLGSRLDEVASFGYRVPAPGTRWAHVDLEPLGGRPGLPGPAVALAADVRTFVREARRILGGAVLEARSLERRRAANAEDRAAWEAASVVDATPWDGPGPHPGRIVAALGRALPPDAIVTTDAGHFGGWAARGLRFRRPGTFIGTTAGAMGFGLPAAIAASLVAPGRPVVALAGDGGFAMTMAELETAVREGAHPVAIVMDNARYQTIRDHQDRRGLPPIATDLGRVDFVGVAQALGARAVRVEADEAFEPALRDALAARRPTVLHLPIDQRWVSVDRLVPEEGTAEAFVGRAEPLELAGPVRVVAGPPAGEPPVAPVEPGEPGPGPARPEEAGPAAAESELAEPPVGLPEPTAEPAVIAADAEPGRVETAVVAEAEPGPVVQAAEIGLHGPGAQPATVEPEMALAESLADVAGIEPAAGEAAPPPVSAGHATPDEGPVEEEPIAAPEVPEEAAPESGLPADEAGRAGAPSET